MLLEKHFSRERESVCVREREREREREMQACLDRVQRLGLGFLPNGVVAGGGLAFQRGNHGSRRRLFHSFKFPTFMALSSSGQVQHSVQGSMGELELLEDFLNPSKDSSREEVTTQKPHLRSWYGKDGELVSRFPCPDCRGRGYIVCPTCDVGTPDSSCMECYGKGLKTCPHCLGKRAVVMQPMYEESQSEENVTRGPLLQIEDDKIIDHMDIHLPPDRKSKRIYSSTPAEVREKIRHALKSLDARTGSVTRRMRRIHYDPVLNAKRIAAIKKAKSTEAARKHASEKMRLYFQEPENRLRRSLSMKGVEYYCSHCGEKGHRRNYCPDLPKSKAIRSYHCSLCGQAGHRRTNCHTVPKSAEENVAGKKHISRCRICKEVGHNARSCQMKPEQVQDIEGGAQA